MDDSGSVVVAYTYDTWGKLVSITGSAATTLGVANPYRYRSYRYDTETGFYYLNSRYYDPETGRFINADEVSVTGVSPMGLTDKNLFTYCDNNPVNRKDDGGDTWVWSIVCAGAGFLASGVSQMMTNALNGEHLGKGVAGAVAGGAVYGAVWSVTYNAASASYASAAAEATANEIAKYLPTASTPRSANMENISESCTRVFAGTLVNGTATLVASNLSVLGDKYKATKYWFRPKKWMSALAGKFAKRMYNQTIAMNAMGFAYKALLGE